MGTSYYFLFSKLLTNGYTQEIHGRKRLWRQADGQNFLTGRVDVIPGAIRHFALSAVSLAQEFCMADP